MKRLWRRLLEQMLPLSFTQTNKNVEVVRHPSIEITQKSLGVTPVKIECTTTQKKIYFFPISHFCCDCQDANIIAE